MSGYYLILVWIVIAYFITHAINVQRIEYVCGRRVRRYSFAWAFIIFLPVIIWAGYRGYVFDTGAYIDEFKKMPLNISGIPEYIDSVIKDEGFYYISALIKVVVGNNEHIYLMVIAFIQAICLIVVYRKYSANYLVSFFLFILSTDYISWMFNGIRQFLAVAISFLCFPMILRKKYASAIIVILLLSFVHESVLLLIPFIFIVQGKPWNKKTLLFILSIIIAIVFVDRFTNLLDSMLAETQYQNVVSHWQELQDDGTSILRVLVYSLPALLSLFGKRTISRYNDPVVNICINMSIVSMGFYIISMFTSGVFIGRLPIYFSLYSYILLPWEIENLFDRRSRQFIYILMIFAYLVFYLYSIRAMF